MITLPIYILELSAFSHTIGLCGFELLWQVLL